DHAGSEILAQLGYICPRGARTITLPASSLQPGMRVGGVRVASLPPQGDPDGARSPIAAVALTALKSELGGDAILEYGSYRLLNGPAPLTGTTTSSGVGAGVVAVPHVGKDLDRSGFAGELAVTDLAGDRGWTDVAVLLVDQNALVDTLCRRVGAGATEYIDLEAIGVLDPGFRGSALVSASYWEHLPAGAPPTPERGRVAIGAASVWRARSVVGRDVPGDEMAIALGTSFEQLPADLAVTLGQPCDRHAPSPPAPPIVSHPDGALTGQVAVPALNRDDVTVTNTGSEAGVALVMAWDEEQSRCAPDCAAPLAVTCTGLLAPGGSWTVTADELPPQADSAIVLSLTAATMAEIGATPASTDKVADVLCAATDGAPCDADRRLRLAYARGLDLMVPTIDGSSANVPMAGAYGPPIAVALGADAEPPGHGKGAYDGVPGSVVLANDPRDGAHTYAVAGVYVLFESDWTDSWLTVQNAGVECANVELRFRAYGDCRRDRICRIDSIGPGSAATFVPQDCVGAGWFGSVVVRGTEPLAVLRHTFTGDRWVTAPAFAAASAYDLDGDWRLSPADVTAMGAALGSRPGDAAWNPRADIDGNQVVNDTDRLLLESNICGADKAQRPEPPDGPNVPATQAALPVLNSAGLDSIPCHTTIEVQNVGDEDTGVVLVAFDAAGDPLEPCAGPTAVECSGIIRPGGAWYMAADGPIDGEGVLGGSRSAMLFSLSAEPVDVFPFEVDDLWFSLVCETLFFGVTGDCDDYAKFKAAFDSGGTFAGIPMDRAIGDPITARVRRECLDSGFSLPSSPTASYAAIGANQFGADDSARGGYVYYAPSVQLWPDSCVSAIHMQNAGAQPATVELWVQSEDPCGSGQLCNVWTIEPGETVATESCGRGEAGGRWSGAARIKSNRPLGVVVETVLNGVVYDYAAMPARVSSDAAGAPLLDGSGQVLFGQLAFDRGQAWDVAVRVQNTSESRPARVRVEFQDAYGAVVLSADDTVCAGGSGTFLSPADGSGSGLPPGAVRVESLPLPDVKGVEPVELVAVLEAVQWSDVTRAMLLGAFSTRLQPEPAALVWPAGSGEGGLESGIGVVAVPALLVADGPERTDALAVTNRVLSPGWTDIAVVLRDQNAVVDVLCRRIYGGQVDYIELGAMPALAAGFHGSAVVSARAWQHPVLDRETGLARNIVGLGAAAVRKSDRFGALAEAVPAYIGAVEGTPLRSMPWPADEPLGNLCYTPPALAHEIYVPNALIGH
ncbi:MAG: hypothetical protein ACK2UL_08110, partial [Anaerolineae bacterium]